MQESETGSVGCHARGAEAIYSAGRKPRDRSGSAVVFFVARRRPGRLAVAVFKRLDFHHDAVFEIDAAHELGRPEVVQPDLHWDLDHVRSDVDTPAIAVHVRLAENGPALDIRGLPAL